MTSLPKTYRHISDLVLFHMYMEKLFASHQIALMQADPPAATSILYVLEELIHCHIKDEEELLLPLYEQHVYPVPPGGAIEFYRREHQQILGFLRRFKAHQPFQQNEISIVHYFDMCTMYKELLEHHHAREHTFLYRLLDQKLPVRQKRRILLKFKAHQKYAI